MMTEIIIVIGAYLFGALPTALIAVRFATGDDVRFVGSRNVGATNALRLAGWKIGLVVTVVDFAKGVIPVLVMSRVNPASRWLAAVMVAAVLGHCYSVWIGFGGGKGVATGFGAFVMIAPVPALAVFAVWLCILLLWRYAALSSTVAAAIFPALIYSIMHPPMVLLAAISVVCALIIVRHAGNIRNLVSGVEPKVGGGQ
jgi:glycerol-3-phosphate acyltransferase PlsY